MSRTDDVVNGIKRMILDGELTPGERLPVEKDLAAMLGVSRGSLREGVRALSVLGVLHTRRGDGTYVTPLDLSLLLAPVGFVVELQVEGQTRQVHTVRRLLECEAARLAAQSITDEALDEAEALLDEARSILDSEPERHERIIEIDIAFHRIIATHSDNQVLAGMIEALASRTARERLWRSLREEGADRRTHEEHLAILRALRARDPEAAKVRMANHLLGVEESLALAGAAPVPLDADADPDDADD
ncbi:transcriptional regulator, GntR family [Glycomyces sambucus]|uniref:Transcriptional regulator, GntR family n=1 Tax=Glycomyces sambucus TaxID=380244 RepID=A0A1G9G0R0_9ACTN|nr:FadR/GntR family transcriptional regulator [Glycomyces sambucus]SDK94232.1 transcriptional regulator, GntR family [Glycomyces sambucus]